MKIEINKIDKTTEYLFLVGSVIYVLSTAYMALTNTPPYRDSLLRNNICLVGDKTSFLLFAIGAFRVTRGYLKYFTILSLATCVTRLSNELLDIFKIVNTDSYVLVFTEILTIFIFMIMYYKRDYLLNIFNITWNS